LRGLKQSRKDGAKMRFDPSTYVTVAERVQLANQKQLEVLQSVVTMVGEKWGYTQVTISLDGKKYVGTASFRLDLTGQRAQATCPLEDAETSALGRAIAFAGISSSRGIASLEEIQEAQRRAEAPTLVQQKPDNVVTLPSSEETTGEMCDAILKETKGVPEVSVLEFLKSKGKDIGDAIGIETLPIDTIKSIFSNLPKFKKALNIWLPK
jgi:hypothetical protein